MELLLQEDFALIDALQFFFPDSSRRTLLSWIKWERVLVDGAVVQQATAHVKKGQTVQLEKKPCTQTIMGIPIIYQDRSVIVINKPPGLLSTPAAKEEISALQLLKLGLKTSSLFPIHRLDQETSGILSFARSKMAEEKLGALFERHELEREYHAILEGHIPNRQGTWENFVREKENYDVEVTSEDLGKKAITHYEVVHRSKKFSFLKLKLETGRKHQIRVQAASRGHPIVGDKRYGSIANPFKRLCLHAHLLSFIDPFTQKKMTFTSKTPFTFPSNKR